jgi:hypothetical protein
MPISASLDFCAPVGDDAAEPAIDDLRMMGAENRRDVGPARSVNKRDNGARSGGNLHDPKFSPRHSVCPLRVSKYVAVL